MANEFIARKGLIVSGSTQMTGSVSLFNTLDVTNTSSFSGPITGSHAVFSTMYNETSTIPGVYLGRNLVDNTPRVGFFNGTATQNWQIDNNSGQFRWYTPNITRMTLTPVGNNVTFTVLGTGSVIVSQGSISASRGITGSLFGSSSYASNADLLDGLNSTVFATTGSNTFIGNQTITGSLSVSGSITENTFPVVTQADIGTAANEIPLNSYLGTLAYQDADAVSVGTLNANGDVSIGSSTVDTHNVTGSLRVSGSAAMNGNFNITGSLDVTGAFTAQTKSFKIPHQTQEGKSLVYGVLESHEHAVYTRGKLTNTNTIQLPEEWTWLVDKESITVQLTPIGKHQTLYVDEIHDTHIIIGNDSMFGNINCFYLIHATRKDVAPLETVV